MAQPWGDNPLSKCPTNTVKCHGIIVSVHACMHVHTEEVHSHTDSDQRGFFFVFCFSCRKNYFLLSRLFHLRLRSCVFFFSQFVLQFSRTSSWCLECGCLCVCACVQRAGCSAVSTLHLWARLNAEFRDARAGRPRI